MASRGREFSAAARNDDEWRSSSDEEDGLPRWIEGDSLAPFVGTPGALLDEAFAFAGLCAEDTVVDVGCGDGRLVVWAVLRGARRGIGIEIDAALAEKAVRNATRRGVGERVRVVRGDVTSADDADVVEALSQATLLTTYLLPEALVKIAPILRRHLQKGRLLTLGWPPPLGPAAKVTTLGAATGAGMDAFLFPRSSDLYLQ